jgi:malonyl-CoA O-methyltransferase
MRPLDPALPDKQQVRRSFGRAAAAYDQYAALQRRVGGDLLQRLECVAGPVRLVVDVGSGTGFSLPHLARRFPDATVLALDLAEAMLQTGRARAPACAAVCGDAEALPLADGCADLLYSNLALQWCGGLEQPLAEFARVLRPGGVAAFSLFGTETLQELRTAWLAVDSRRRVNAFAAEAAVCAALQAAGLHVAGLSEQKERVAYPSVRALMGELKGLGAHNASGDRPRHMTGKAALARMESAYAAQMAGAEVFATYQVISVVARKP